MNIGKWARLLLAAAPLLAGCGDFWQSPNGSSTTSFSLANSGNLALAPGATSGNTATITVTPGSSFSGTVALTCAVTTTISSAVSPATCSLSPTSLTLSASTAQSTTLTATTTSTTTTGAYQLAVTGTSGSIAQSTTVCVEVTSGSATCSTNAGSSGVFYVLNQTTDQVVALKIASGQLTTIGAVTPPSSPLAIAVAPNDKFLYVSTGLGIYLYSIGSTGALTLGNSSQAVSSEPATTMQVDATNGWLVDAVSGVAQLNAVAISSSTGGLAAAGESEQHVALPAIYPIQLAISPTDSSSCADCYVFVAMGSGGTEIVNFNPGNASPFGGTGNIALVNSSAGGANTVAVDPTNRLLYVGESAALSATQSGGLRAFTIASGGVTPIASPYPSQGTGPSSILPSADGKYVYVANQSVSGSADGNIASYSVATSGLTSVGSVAAGATGLIGLAEDSTGGFLFAVDFAGSPDLEAYTMSSGTLTSVLSSTTGTDPVGAVAIAAAP